MTREHVVASRASGYRALDCSRPGIALFWFAAGAALALAVMSAAAVPGWTSLLRVGADNPRLADIERELGPVAGSDPVGHDGQLYYMIARDPLGVRGTPEALAAFDNNGARYRYRRILFPLLAGGFGRFDGRATLLGMVGLLVLGFGLMAVAIADIASQLKVGGTAVLGAILNAGAVVSLLVLTADVLALGLALTGVALALRERTSAALLPLALAALTKELYGLVPLSIGAWLWHGGRRRAGLIAAVVPVLPVSAWNLWLAVAMPGPSPALRNLGWPFQGLVQAAVVWLKAERNPVEMFLLVFTTAAMAGAAVALIAGRNRLLRWIVVPWLVIAGLATLPVWGKPNNAARAFAILWPVTVLLLAAGRTSLVIAEPRDQETHRHAPFRPTETQRPRTS